MAWTLSSRSLTLRFSFSCFSNGFYLFISVWSILKIAPTSRNPCHLILEWFYRPPIGLYNCAYFFTSFSCRAVFFNLTALLSGTLKTFQHAVCDEETMTLKCPPGTTISVEHAQYGRAGIHGNIKCNSSAPLMIAGDKSTNQTCIWPHSLQVCTNEIPLSHTGRDQSSGSYIWLLRSLKINTVYRGGKTKVDSLKRLFYVWTTYRKERITKKKCSGEARIMIYI